MAPSPRRRRLALPALAFSILMGIGATTHADVSEFWVYFPDMQHLGDEASPECAADPELPPVGRSYGFSVEVPFENPGGTLWYRFSGGFDSAGEGAGQLVINGQEMPRQIRFDLCRAHQLHQIHDIPLIAGKNSFEIHTSEREGDLGELFLWGISVQVVDLDAQVPTPQDSWGAWKSRY